MRHVWILLIATGCGLLGPQGGDATFAEAAEALAQARLATAPEELTAAPVEVVTDVTLGDRLQAAAEALRASWDAQAPCAEVTTTQASTRIDYGDLTDACTWRGRTYAGVHAITVERAGASTAVTHAWTGFSDGTTDLDGTAHVTWDLGSATRQVVSELTWSRGLGATDVTGDHVYGLVDAQAGVLGGLTLDGTRAWTNDAGRWDLDMSGIVLRLQDPAPEAGAYTLVDPDGHTFELTFTRRDAGTIRVDLTGTRWPLTFDVTATGAVLRR